ncbi:hypothetical protein [Gemmatimonas sp.]|jgi:hypothetical protein|uniref:hypothetical protein n=1 Tax=Gemmatimonas sp. TaxID=1962908 RepID=UPI0037BF0181
MAKRNMNRVRAAQATVALFVMNGIGPFGLLLLWRSATFSQAREAQRALEAFIADRVRKHVDEVLRRLTTCPVTQDAAASVTDSVSKSDVIDASTLVTKAHQRVMAALPQCASRSRIDFDRWLDRVIADALDEDPQDDGPSPSSPSAGAQVAAAWALHTLPIPRAARDALISAVLHELTPPERQVLLAMQGSQGSWVATAEMMELTVLATKRLHRRATDRAHAVAVRIAAEAAGVNTAVSMAA